MIVSIRVLIESSTFSNSFTSTPRESIRSVFISEVEVLETSKYPNTKLHMNERTRITFAALSN